MSSVAWFLLGALAAFASVGALVVVLVRWFTLVSVVAGLLRALAVQGGGGVLIARGVDALPIAFDDLAHAFERGALYPGGPPVRVVPPPESESLQ